jgi:hypothetical protein
LNFMVKLEIYTENENRLHQKRFNTVAPNEGENERTLGMSVDFAIHTQRVKSFYVFVTIGT